MCRLVGLQCLPARERSGFRAKLCIYHLLHRRAVLNGWHFQTHSMFIYMCMLFECTDVFMRELQRAPVDLKKAGGCLNLFNKYPKP